MSTGPRVLRIDPTSPEAPIIQEAAAVLSRGGLVAFPTETVYGLGARALDAEHVARIFEAKGRPSTHPLILHVDGEAMARTVASTWPARASALARAFWPGPLTLVVPRADVVPDAVTGGLATVAVRMPAHPVALALVRAVGAPLAAPSANAHTHVSPTTAAHVARSLGDRVELVLDAGPCEHGIESTVIDVTCDPPRVLRPGATSLEALRAVVPDAVYEESTAAEGAARASPGLAAKHYAPRARLVLVDGANVAGAADELARAGARVAAVVWSDATDAAVASAKARAVVAVSRTLGPGAEAYARDLFAALFDVDEAGCDVVLVERVPEEPAWWAVQDRLRRAARPD